MPKTTDPSFCYASPRLPVTRTPHNSSQNDREGRNSEARAQNWRRQEKGREGQDDNVEGKDDDVRKKWVEEKRPAT